MSDYFDRIERQLVESVEAGLPRRRRLSPSGLPATPAGLRPGRRHLGIALGVAAVLVVVAVLFGVRSGSSPSTAVSQPTSFLYLAQPTASHAAVARTVAVIRDRIHALGLKGATVAQIHSGGEVSISLPGRSDGASLSAELSATGQLSFYDWEASALTTTGRTVASGLRDQSQQALTISQGAGGYGQGGMSLYAAVQLATEQAAGAAGSRLGSAYYLFGTGGSRACALAARDYGVSPAATGSHCLLAGPAASRADMTTVIPPGVRATDGRLLVVRQGTVVLEAVPSQVGSQKPIAAPAAQFYVLKDDVALSGDTIINPHVSTDSGGSVDVEFGFTKLGGKQFTALTSAIAKRGSRVSTAGSIFDQHFGIAVDGRLISVPSIDFKTYPFGVPAGQGAELTGGFTRSSARALVADLRYGALPASLSPVATG